MRRITARHLFETRRAPPLRRLDPPREASSSMSQEAFAFQDVTFVPLPRAGGRRSGPRSRRGRGPSGPEAPYLDPPSSGVAVRGARLQCHARTVARRVSCVVLGCTQVHLSVLEVACTDVRSRLHESSFGHRNGPQVRAGTLVHGTFARCCLLSALWGVEARRPNPRPQSRPGANELCC